MTDALDIHMYGYPIGSIRRLAAEDYVLEYDSSWSGADESVPLSLSLPLSSRTHRGPELTHFIDNLLPDNPEVRQRWATDAGLDTTEPFALLAEYGQDVAGAASFRAPGSDESGSRRALSNAEIAERIREIRGDAAAWHDRRRPAPGQFSLGGAQRKFSLAQHDGRWFETSGSDPSTHLFKPQVAGIADGELIEYIVMRSAWFLGIPTAKVELFDEEGEHSLVVERFDRRIAGERTTRLHQEDLLQALGLPRLRKYEKDRGPGVDAIARLLADHADEGSRARYAAMLFFSWIVLSSDAHAKNYSVFLESDGATLTPLYDASSLVPYLGDDLRLDEESLLNRAHGVELSVRYGASALAGSVARFELDAIARTCGIDAGDLLALVGVLLLEISDVVTDVADDMPQALQTDTVARLVEWMPIRARQAAEALGLGGVIF